MKKLKLKEEIKQRGEDVVIYRHRSRLVFPIDTPEEDYPKWQSKGFNIFRCVECNSMDCIGDCTVEDEYISPLEDPNDKTVDIHTEEISEEITEEISDEKMKEYDMFTLKELRLFFPDIKAVSKKDFIRQIEELKNE